MVYTTEIRTENTPGVKRTKREMRDCVDWGVCWSDDGTKMETTSRCFNLEGEQGNRGMSNKALVTAGNV